MASGILQKWQNDVHSERLLFDADRSIPKSRQLSKKTNKKKNIGTVNYLTL